VAALRFVEGRSTPSTESLAEETPVALAYNGHSHAVMMATPTDLEDFAWGFTVTEGIAAAGEIELVDCLHTDEGISLQLLIPQQRYDVLRQRQRNLTGRSGCGLCGVESLAEAIQPIRHVTGVIPVDHDKLLAGFELLTRSQPLNQACGAVHAAALMNADGSLLVREDVGRHNAVDKVIGAALRTGLPSHTLLVTSRASYEIVHKAAQAGCGLVAAISAPTALAVRLAREAGIVLAGFARGERMTLYASAEHLISNDS
jgi:formate dehydrogenase accessory protein FdhD